MGLFGKTGGKPDREAFLRAAADCPRTRKGGTAVLEAEDREPASKGYFMAGLGVFFLGFCAVAIAAFPSPSDREAALVGSAIFAPIGVGLILGGVNLRIRYRYVSIAGDRVSFERKNLLGLRSFEESLGSYLCVLPLTSEVTSRGELEAMAYYARLIHRSDPERDLSLLVHTRTGFGMFVGQGEERKPYEDFARSVDLPLATVGADGSVTLRAPEELDRPLGERGGRALEPFGPERPFPSRAYRVEILPDGFDAVRGHPGYWIPFLLFAGGAAAAVRFAGNTEAAFGLPLVLGVFSLFMAAFALTRSRLRVSGGRAEAVHTVAGISILRRETPLSEIEEVDLIIDPSTRRRTLRIGSDRGTIDWAAGESEEVQAWFRDAVLRAIRR